MPKLPQVKGERVIRALRTAGWEVIRVHGSHHVLTHPERPGATVIVSVHPRPLKRGTLADILKAAGLTVEQFRELL